jgi:diguanylate cyclase (GGDEF)-like protein/PAS domain S-box-containing protein
VPASEPGRGFSEPSGDHGSWEYDLSTREIIWSDGVYRIHGVTRDEFPATFEAVRELVHPEDLERYSTVVRDAIASRAPFAVQHRIVRPEGGERVVVVRGEYMPGEGVESDRLIGTTQDVTGREGAEERLWHLANHDPLTGLFNRRRLMEELRREVAMARRTGSPGAVLMIDLDRFKDVNDSLGHIAGDNLLVRVADGLRKRMRSTDTLARLGGDEFALVLPGCPTTEARKIGGKLLEGISRDAVVRIAGAERPISASVGVAPFGGTAEADVDGLLVEADLAMYRAKAHGGGEVEVFDEEMRAELADRVRVEGELRGALERGELEVFYQPITALADGSIAGCEALVRWRHPQRGLVEPDEFIAVAEEHGLIHEIGSMVLRDACERIRRWRNLGFSGYIAVNVSPMQLTQGETVAEVVAALGEFEVPGPLMCMEVTETSLVNDAAILAPPLEELRQHGVRIAIDDFGGGARASLGFLSVLPIDVIKVDRQFVQGIADRREDRAIVAAVMSMAEELDLEVIAEGVETERQDGNLRELGCRLAQGYLYARPMPAVELDLDGYSAAAQPGVGDPMMIREFMRQIGIPARVGA